MKCISVKDFSTSYVNVI